MPQWRKLHTKTTESLDVNDMPDDFTRLMWVLLPLKLCREGRGLDMPAWIKSQIFPLRSDVSLDMVADAMDWFESRGMIDRYVVDGRPYFQINSWHKYQGNTSREADSPYPAPDEADDDGQSGATHEPVTSDSGTDADADADANTDAEADAGAGVGAAAKAYENEIGNLTPHISECITDAVDEHGSEWVVDAVGEAAKHNARKWAYVDAILNRWHAEGRHSARASPNGSGRQDEPELQVDEDGTW